MIQIFHFIGSHAFHRFTIPELPDGEQLVLNLKTTWGDRHYVGLNGIEVFSSEGYLVPIKKVNLPSEQLAKDYD